MRSTPSSLGQYELRRRGLEIPPAVRTGPRPSPQLGHHAIAPDVSRRPDEGERVSTDLDACADFGPSIELDSPAIFRLQSLSPIFRRRTHFEPPRLHRLAPLPDPGREAMTEVTASPLEGGVTSVTLLPLIFQ
jgi:hypothetical protein